MPRLVPRMPDPSGVSAGRLTRKLSKEIPMSRFVAAIAAVLLATGALSAHAATKKHHHKPVHKVAKHAHKHHVK